MQVPEFSAFQLSYFSQPCCEAEGTDVFLLYVGDERVGTSGGYGGGCGREAVISFTCEPGLVSLLLCASVISPLYRGRVILEPGSRGPRKAQLRNAN